MTQTEKIARAFSSRVLKYIGREKMKIVIKRNASAKYRRLGCCATGDFCDSNVFMARAFRHVTGRHMNMADRNVALWNKAWDVAVTNKFFLEK